MLEQENKRLKEEISLLRKRLSKNSSNSSKPPSSDGLSKSVSLKGSLKSNTVRKSGGQKGHKALLFKPVCPDQVLTSEVVNCDHCQTDLSKIAVESYVKRQVHDLPEIQN